MNERIKQLMGQTLDEKFSGTWSVMDMQDLTKFADRFAELIVEEMLRTCEEHPAWTGRMIGEQIKQYFGVEE